MVYTVEHRCSDRGANTVSDRPRPLETRQRDAAGDRAGLNPARVDELLARIGALGELVDATAQRSVDALRRARGEPGVESWDDATAGSLLELAARIEAQREQLDAALESDRARLAVQAVPGAEAVGDLQPAMDPAEPGMI